MSDYAPDETPPDVLLGVDVSTRKPVYLPYKDRPKGVAIVGKPGTGKSSTLEQLIMHDLMYGTAGMVIDPHGELTQRVMLYATPEQAQRIILLEADSTAPFGLNLLALRKTSSIEESIAWSADIVVSTIKKLYGQADEYLPRVESKLDLAVRTLIPNDGTLADVPRLFRNEDFRHECLRNVTDTDVLDDWTEYDALRKMDQSGQNEAVINRLRRMLGRPLMQGIFGSRETTVPFDQIFHGDSMLLVSLPAEKISPERCNFIGSLLLSAVADRVFARSLSGEPQSRIHLYIDEVQRFATSTTKTLLEEGRKFEVGLTMAHQTLQQIESTQVSGAARLVGTLIVMAVTRPDADQLAGEFPVNPTPERLEKVTEVDGTDPVYILSSTPAEDLYLEPHDDPDVDLAARSFFAFLHPSTDDKRKSAGVPPRPGGVPVDDRVKVTASDAEAFLFRAMRGELCTDELFTDALIESQVMILPGYYSRRAVFFWFRNDSPKAELDGVIHYRTCPRSSYTSRYEITLGRCSCRQQRDSALCIEHREKVDQIFDACRHDQMERVRSWVLTYLGDRDALRADEKTEAFQKADLNLLWESDKHYWDGIWYWTNPLQKSSSGEFQAATRALRVPQPRVFWPFADADDDDVLETSRRWNDNRAAIDILRQRLRWLVILAEGLERSPLYVTNGQQQPRRVTRLIPRPAQSYADALAGLAAKLVKPPGRYLAHVRLLDSYHLVKLNPPIEGNPVRDGQDPDPTQPDDIRTRSRALLTVTPEEGAVLPRTPPDQPSFQRVTRRPRPRTLGE